jgi:hypothetical protein
LPVPLACHWHSTLGVTVVGNLKSGDTIHNSTDPRSCLLPRAMVREARDDKFPGHARHDLTPSPLADSRNQYGVPRIEESIKVPRHARMAVTS